MAFFKFRKGADEAVGKPRKSAAAQAESVEAMRRRARHRLIGAAVLVLAGVVGFPLLFDTQPRPIAVDIPIEIPDRAKARPLTGAAADRTPAAPAVAPAPPAPAPAPVAAAPGGVSPSAAAPAPGAPAAPPAAASAVPAPPATRPTESAAARAEPAPSSRADAPAAKDEAARARALLEGRSTGAASATTTAADPGEARFVVQVGAFADAALARDTRARLERAGLKTYTHVAETKEGKRIRVRLGPFATRAEADKAAEQARRLDLPATVLTL